MALMFDLYRGGRCQMLGGKGGRGIWTQCTSTKTTTERNLFGDDQFSARDRSERNEMAGVHFQFILPLPGIDAVRTPRLQKSHFY